MTLPRPRFKPNTFLSDRWTITTKPFEDRIPSISYCHHPGPTTRSPSSIDNCTFTQGNFCHLVLCPRVPQHKV